MPSLTGPDRTGPSLTLRGTSAWALASRALRWRVASTARYCFRRFPAPAGRATRRRRCRTKEAIRPGRDPARPRAPASAPRQCRCSRRCRRTEPNGVPACRGDNAITGRDSLPVRRSVAAVTRMAAGSVGVSALSTQAAAWPRSNNPCTCRRQRPNPLYTRWRRHRPVRQDQGCARCEMRYQRLLGAAGAKAA